MLQTRGRRHGRARGSLPVLYTCKYTTLGMGINPSRHDGSTELWQSTQNGIVQWNI